MEKFWSKNDDKILIEKTKKYKMDWKKVSKFFTTKFSKIISPTFVKLKYQDIINLYDLKKYNPKKVEKIPCKTFFSKIKE